MPHYADGTPAQVGDIVRGKGYNIKDETGELAEITGVLLYVNPNATACNVQVGVVEIAPLQDTPLAAFYQASLPAHICGASDHVATLKIEYGQADHFTKV